jgi:pilus assembly protein Flp/PilA
MRQAVKLSMVAHGGWLVFVTLTGVPTMEKFLNATRRFAREEDGVTAIEYGLIAALIAVAIIVAVTAIGTELNVIFEKVRKGLGGV